MFYYIKGTVVHKDVSFAVIDAHGVGYKIYTSATSLSRIETGAEAVMYTYMYIREDIMDIYQDVLAHRIKLNTQARGQGIAVSDVLKQVFEGTNIHA